MSDSPPSRHRPLDRLRALVFSNERLQAELAPVEDPALLSERVLALAADNGIPLAAGDFADLLRPDPVGISDLSDPVPMQRGWPPPAWLPVALLGLPGGGAAVDWAHFAGAPLAETFFRLSARPVAGRPFNRLFRYRTRLEDFVAAAMREPLPAPAGFVFHMSRSGSTLVSQMLAALPGSVVVSEAPPLDAAVGLAEAGAGGAVDPADLVRAMVGALGRSAGPGPGFVKLHFWHALALPLFRRAFPSVPWLFLYRDPVEVMVSQMRSRGAETMLGVDPALPAEEQIAQALARVCRAALDAAPGGRGLFVDYADLPEAVFADVLPHFGVDPGDEIRAALEAAAVRDTKSPSRAFTADGVAKQEAATQRVRRAAGLHLAAAHEGLKALGH